MQAQLFIPWLNDYAQQAKINNERRLVVLSGSESWALSLLSAIEPLSAALLAEGSSEPNQAMADGNTDANYLIFGDSTIFPGNVQQKRYRDKLGSESEIIVFADGQFSIDAFAALSGTLKAGGIFFLVLPNLEDKCQKSLFFKRLYALIQAMRCHAIISQEQVSPEKALQTPITLQESSKKTVQAAEQESGLDKLASLPLGCITAEQYQGVEAIIKVVSGHRKRPLVLTADRGRGKSSALAIACAQLLKSHEYEAFEIAITAPDAQALAVFFKQLTISFPDAVKQGNTVSYGKANLTFIPVDRLLSKTLKVNLLLVDEAAAIPVYLLEQLLSRYHRMVFSSTVHGYEGAGRGFTLKFQKSLDNLCPQWTSLHIKQPIRWRQNDPLEQLVFDSCLLNAELPIIQSWQENKSIEHSTVGSGEYGSSLVDYDFKVISANELVTDESLLQQVFAVLVTAHYQTKPSDLQLLLDNPQVQLACLFSSSDNKGEVIAVALLMNEGSNVDEGDIKAIKNSQRRLRNHFLPQSLLSHCGFEQAFDYRYLRIMRIAVHPQIQQQGIGLHFIKEIEGLALKQGVDFIGSSFGVNQQLLSFWFKARFTSVRIGFTKDKASGEHSALLVKGLNSVAQKKQQQFSREFYRAFDYLLLEEYKGLPSELVRLLLTQQNKQDLQPLSALDKANVLAYVKGERLFSVCVYSLYLWLKFDLLEQDKYCARDDIKNSLVLVARLIQKHDSETVCQKYGLTGKKMLNQHIKTYICSRLKII